MPLSQKQSTKIAALIFAFGFSCFAQKSESRPFSKGQWIYVVAIKFSKTATTFHDANDNPKAVESVSAEFLKWGKFRLTNNKQNADWVFFVIHSENAVPSEFALVSSARCIEGNHVMDDVRCVPLWQGRGSDLRQLVQKFQREVLP